MIRDLARLLCVCVTLALTASYDAGAQSKKKGKEPELAISKRGNLIFEDDFSGKELDWTSETGRGEWKIMKNMLTTKSNSDQGTNAEKFLSILRYFPKTTDMVLEFRIIAPLGCFVNFMYSGTGAKPECPAWIISTGRQVFYLAYTDENGKGEEIMVTSFQYQKPRWINVVFEMLDGKLAVTVDNKTIRYDLPAPDKVPANQLRMNIVKRNADILAIDDVKVWEALPKDEEAGKDKKKK